MARNKLAGTSRGNSKSAKFYQKHPESRRKKVEYDTVYQSTPRLKKYRALLNKINRKKGTYGNHDTMDESHISPQKTRKEHYSKNRARKLVKYLKK